jgi:hypothetical protein
VSAFCKKHRHAESGCWTAEVVLGVFRCTTATLEVLAMGCAASLIVSAVGPQGHGTSRLTPQCGQRSAGLSFRPEGAKPLARLPNIPPMSPPHFGHGNLLANAAQATRHTAPTAIVKRRVSGSSGSSGGSAKPKKAIATRVVFDHNMRRLSRPRIVSAARKFP